jgi:hypothetical protein
MAAGGDGRVGGFGRAYREKEERGTGGEERKREEVGFLASRHSSRRVSLAPSGKQEVARLGPASSTQVLASLR